ncbi:MAG: AzlD domain-containing protein [Campylobacter sp.]|nr:AzlD domain-containing protein [Campylobacter sp.]
MSEIINATSSNFYLFMTLIIASIATFLTRSLPYFFLKKHSSHPILMFLQKNMGLLIMVILVFYALKPTKLTEFPFGLPEILSVIICIILQIYKKNALVSIAFSTAFYMILIRALS